MTFAVGAGGSLLAQIEDGGPQPMVGLGLGPRRPWSLAQDQAGAELGWEPKRSVDPRAGFVDCRSADEGDQRCSSGTSWYQ